MPIDEPKARITRREQAQQRRTQLLEVAAKVFGRLGYDGSSVRSIAREAGVTEGLVYYYFNGKEQLFDEVLRSISPTLIIQEVMENMDGQDLEQTIKQLLMTLESTMETTATKYPALIQDCHHSDEAQEYHRKIVEGNVNSLAVYLMKLKSDGLISPSTDERSLAMMLMGLVFSVFFMWGHEKLTEGRPYRRKQIDDGIQVILFGVCTEAGRVSYSKHNKRTDIHTFQPA